jgi:hypothetical protein
LIQVAEERRDGARPQLGAARWRGGQRQHLDPTPQDPCHTHTNITATDDEDALTAKTRGQRAEGALV